MRNYKTLLAAATFLLSATALTGPASASGVFDFLDPCIASKADFAAQRREFLSHAEVAQKAVEGMAAPQEFRDAWMRALRDPARASFDKDVAPLFTKLGFTNLDLAFDEWLKQEIASYDADQLTQLINSNFRELAKEELLRATAESASKFEDARGKLNASCKSDVGNQALRLSLAPVGWVKGNIDGAKREKNIVAGVVRAATGISARDIAKYGVLGGPNSELRKLANTIAGGENGEVRKTLRFLDPGNTKGLFGGSNSVFRKPFG